MSVYLRALEISDLETVWKWRQDENIWRLVVGPRVFVSKEMERAWIERAASDDPRSVNLAICLTRSNLHIGNAYLSNIDLIARVAEASIVIGASEEWGKGYAAAALAQLLEFGFNEKGLERISAGVLAYNTRSVRLHEKLGFRHEGTLRSAVYKNGSRHDLLMYGILRDEFLHAFTSAPEVMENEFSR